MRTLRNTTIERWRANGSPAAPHRPGEGETVAHRDNGDRLPRYHFAAPTRDTWSLQCNPPLRSWPNSPRAFPSRPAGQAVLRFGRATSSPPQFGHKRSSAWVQSRQYVHSWLQMKASPSARSGPWQRSHSVRISSDILLPCLEVV